jgi:hypothetical protein
MRIDKVEVVVAHGLLTGEMFCDSVLGDDAILIGCQVK